MKRICFILMIAISLMPQILYGARKGEAVDTLTASRVFADLPISVLDLVDRSRRLDMLDYYAADSIAKIPNAMEGLSYLDTVAPDYLKVVLTPVTTLGVKVLPCKKGDVILTAYTIGDKDQAYDTDLRFYDSSYQEIDRKKFMKLATLDDFFDYPDKAVKELVARLVPFPTVLYEPEAVGSGMSAQLTVGQFMSADDYARIKQYLRPKLHYTWNGSKFNLEK